MRPLSLAVVGAPYPNKRGPTRRFEIEVCKPGDPILLQPEPENPADEHAIAVFSERDVQLGYLASERAVYIGKMMRDGHDIVAVFQHATSWGAWIRVGFDGESPELPPAPQPVSDDQGFWPDEIFPDV